MKKLIFAMSTRMESGQLHVTKGETSSDLALKVVTALLITFAAAVVAVFVESHFVGEHALDLLNTEHHSAAYF